MALSSATAQSRELSELRNHLKWLDEERRKSARRLAELEQKLAQQGRELQERDQKIQDLEWLLGQVSEKVERIPDADSGIAGQEQRIQDLEWHLSNINAQLVRLPNTEDELTRFRAEVDQSVEEMKAAIRAEQVERVNTVAADLEALRLNIAQATEDLEADLSDVRGANAELIAQRAAELAVLRQDYDEFVVRQDAQLAALREATGPTDQYDQALSMLRAEQEAYRARLEADLYALREQQDELHEKTQAADRVDDELMALREQQAAFVSRFEAELAGLRNQKEELSAQLREEWQEATADFDEKVAAANERLSTIEGLNDTRKLAESLSHLEKQQVESLTQLEKQQVESLTRLEKQQADAVARLEQELELRQAEEVRLANLITLQESRSAPVALQVEEMQEAFKTIDTRLAASERAADDVRAAFQEFDDAWKPVLMEASRRLGPMNERLTVLNNSALKADASIESLTTDQAELRELIVNLNDDLRHAQEEIDLKLSGWQAVLDEQKDTVERFSQQWVSLSNQYKEARMAVQNFAHWQKTLEQQKRESTELLRVESNRMQARWEGVLQEIEDRLKNFEVELNQKWQSYEIENEQKWASARRGEQQWREELAAIDELILKLQQDNRNLIWRVQAAQADAIKQWPRLLMEEIEKAVDVNPNRRLPSLASSGTRGDMSVREAIEQGLITLDYEDDTAAEE